MTRDLDDHFFRHAYGHLVAVLVRRVGTQHLELVEDAVQDALLAGLQSWTHGELPDNPSAWLYRVAHNRVVDELRRRSRQDRLVARLDAPEVSEATEPDDALLQMLFSCCDEAIPVESQLVLALKTLCGFDVNEVAERLFLTSANVYKRLERARVRLRELPFAPDLSAEQYVARRPAVHAIVYVLFTEGHLSSHPEQAIRRELCDEAKRLAVLLAEHSLDGSPEACALVALLHFHTARLPARVDECGDLLLLEAQDRSRWDQREIERGLAWLARSARGSTFSRYHAEAGIAAEHCLATSFEATRWDRIVECYALLEELAPSPLHAINRALAVAEWRGPAEGLAIVEALDPPAWLEGRYQWAAALADLHRRCGNAPLARRYRAQAIEAAPSAAIRTALERRLQ